MKFLPAGSAEQRRVRETPEQKYPCVSNDDKPAAW